MPHKQIGSMLSALALIACALTAWPASAQKAPSAEEIARIKCVGGGPITIEQRIEGCTAVLELRKSTSTKRKAAYYLRGNIFSDQSAWPQAIADYSAAIKIDPNYAAAWRGRAEAYNQSKDYDRAIADFSRFIQLDPNSDGWLGRGTVWMAKDDVNQAIADFSEMISRHPNHEMPYV